MFNDKYGLTKAVLEGRKTMTRRVFKGLSTNYDRSIYGSLSEGFNMMCSGHVIFRRNEYLYRSTYKVGEVVAVSQAYRDIPQFNPETYEDVMLDHGTICEASHPYSHLMRSGGWDNKMFVKADLMPHRIRITNIKVERLQDISEEDCLREGVLKKSDFPHKKSLPFYFDGGKHSWDNSFSTPRQAFAALIDKVSGKGVWKSNPLVFVYEFELVK